MTLFGISLAVIATLCYTCIPIFASDAFLGVFLLEQVRFSLELKQTMVHGTPFKSDTRVSKKMNAYSNKVTGSPAMAWRNLLKVGRDDPRKAIHALKFGVSVTLVSLLYLVDPLAECVGDNAIWAVMTVIVVLEFTAGATLFKGMNRGLGTLLAGSMAFFIQLIAHDSGKVFRAVLVGTTIFLVGAMATYVRFVPYIKKNYDYGVVIFILTFNLITHSEYLAKSAIEVAEDRLYMIGIGCGVCLLMTLLVYPIWSGQDLHNATVTKLQGLARSITACVNEYFDESDPENGEKNKPSDDHVVKAVLDTKSSDEQLAMFASWEPRHLRYKFPWKQYVKVGAVLRRFGYTIVALHGCLHTEIQTPKSLTATFKDPCVQLAREVSNALEELADSIKNRRHFSPKILSDNLNDALQELDVALKSQPRLFLGSNANGSGLNASSRKVSMKEWKSNRWEDHQAEVGKSSLRPTLSIMARTSMEFAEVLPFAAFTSLLVETVAKLDPVIDEVEELSRVAHFKDYNPREQVEVTVNEDKPNKAELDSPDRLPSRTME